MALGFVKEPKEITFTDSPQFVLIQDGSAFAETSVTVEVYVWEGLKTPRPPSSLRYTLNLATTDRPDIGVGATSVNFEISKFLREFIDVDEFIPTNANEYNEGNGVWYQYTAETLNSPKINSDVKFALNGWGKYSEGSNPGTTILAEDGKVFGNNSSNIIYDDGSDYLIPVYVGNTSTNTELQSLQGGDFLLAADLGFTLNSLLSSRQIAYVRIGKTLYGSAWEHNKVLDYLVNDNLSSSTTTYRCTIECFKGEAKSLKYINSFGAQSQFPIRGKKDETLRFNRTRYDNLNLDITLEYDVLEHGVATFQANGKRIFNISTNWLYEDSNLMIEELLLSKYIWLEVGAEVVPVVITDANKKMINRTWSKQVGYDLTLEEANPLINQVI